MLNAICANSVQAAFTILFTGIAKQKNTLEVNRIVCASSALLRRAAKLLIFLTSQSEEKAFCYTLKHTSEP